MSTIHRDVRTAVESGSCVLFLGAGVHARPPEDSRFVYADDKRPLQAAELTARLAEECGFYDEFPKERFPADYPLSLQRVSLHMDRPKGGGRKKLVTELRRYLQTGKAPSPALQALAKLPFKIIVTTNYDNLLEMALRKADKDPAVVVYNRDRTQITKDASEAPTEKRPLVFKIHGDLGNDETVVVTDEDYIHFICRMTQPDPLNPVPSTVKYWMMKWPTLFLGYSLRDYNLRMLIRTLRWGLDEANFPLSFSVDRSPDPLIKHYWEDEANFVFFIVEDLWNFVPRLYVEITGHDLSQLSDPVP